MIEFTLVVELPGAAPSRECYIHPVSPMDAPRMGLNARFVVQALPGDLRRLHAYPHLRTDTADLAGEPTVLTRSGLSTP